MTVMNVDGHARWDARRARTAERARGGLGADAARVPEDGASAGAPPRGGSAWGKGAFQLATMAGNEGSLDSATVLGDFVARSSTALPAFVSLAFFQMIATLGWMMMAMASRAVRVFYAASNAPLTLEDDGGATLPLHATEAPRPQPAWVRAASEPEELQTEFSFAPAPEAD